MATEQSPRIEKDGTIKWYEGDVFYLHFLFEEKQSGEIIELYEGDAFEIEFFNKSGKLVAKKTITSATEGKYVCHIDEKTTRAFPVGEYSYTIQYCRNENDTIQTVENCGHCVVEGRCGCRA